MAVAQVDFAAVGRVSRYAELKDIRVTCVSAKCDPKSVEPMEPKFSHACSVVGNQNGILDVSCEYEFSGTAAQKKIVDVGLTYLVTYTLSAPAPLSEGDLAQFAAANGTLHSWPFVREFLHGLTLRMGVPAFKLGVMHFVPTPAPQAPAVEEKASDTLTPPL